MSSLTESAAWKALESHRSHLQGVQMRDLFRSDPDRARRHTLQAAGLTLDYSKNLLLEDTLPLLVALARQQELPRWIERMFAGERINVTEDRAALHTALRAQAPVFLDGKDVVPDVLRV